MTIKTLGMGIVKFLKTTAPRKTLTVDKGALRISEINKKLKRTPKKAHVPGFTEKASVRQNVAEDHAQEVLDIYKGKK
jgi:hypothetical protein